MPSPGGDIALGTFAATVEQGAEMAHEVRGVVARAKGEPVTVETIAVPDPARARPWSRCRRAGCATPTSTTARAASTTTSRSCSATRPPAIVEAVGPDVTDVAPGDFVDPQLAGRVRRRAGPAAAGRPLVLLRHATTPRRR